MLFGQTVLFCKQYKRHKFLYCRCKYNTFYYKVSRFCQGNKSPFTAQRFTYLAFSPIIMESTIPIFITFCYLWDWFEYIWVFPFLCFLLSCSLSFCFARQLRANTHWPRCISELHPYSSSMGHEQLTSRGIAADSVLYYLSSLCASDGRLSGCSATVMESVALKWADRSGWGRQREESDEHLTSLFERLEELVCLNRRLLNQTIPSVGWPLLCSLDLLRGIHSSFWYKNWTTGIFSPPLLSQSAPECFSCDKILVSDLSPFFFLSFLTLQTRGEIIQKVCYTMWNFLIIKTQRFLSISNPDVKLWQSSLTAPPGPQSKGQMESYTDTS